MELVTALYSGFLVGLVGLTDIILKNQAFSKRETELQSQEFLKPAQNRVVGWLLGSQRETDSGIQPSGWMRGSHPGGGRSGGAATEKLSPQDLTHCGFRNRCEGPDSNRRTTKDQALNLTPLAKLSYPRS